MNDELKIIYENMRNEDIGKCFQILKNISNKNNVDVSGGNCGQSSYAVNRFLKDYYDITTDISLITNVNTEYELIYGEPDVYHVFLSKDGEYYDEFGLISSAYLLDLALDQYGDENPQMFTFNMLNEGDKILKIISTQTNYNKNWNYFYDILENSDAVVCRDVFPAATRGRDGSV